MVLPDPELPTTTILSMGRMVPGRSCSSLPNVWANLVATNANVDAQLELTRPFISEERFGWQYPFGALVRSEAKLGIAGTGVAMTIASGRVVFEG